MNYEIKKGSTVISSGSDTTDSNGQVAVTYTGTGVGDVDIVFKYGSLLQETYEVEDCIDYQPLTSNADESKWTIPSAVKSSSIYGYSSDGWKFGNASSYSRIIHQTSLTFPFSMEFKLTELNSTSSGDGVLIFIYSNGSTPNFGIGHDRNGWWLGTTSNRSNDSFTSGDVIRVEYGTSNSVKLFKNNVQIVTGTHSVTGPTNVEFHTGNSRYCRIKNFKVKAL